MTIQKIVKKIGISVGVVGFWSLTFASTVNVDLDEEHEAKFKKMLAALRELDDVQEIYHNANIVEEDEE